MAGKWNCWDQEYFQRIWAAHICSGSGWHMNFLRKMFYHRFYLIWPWLREENRYRTIICNATVDVANKKRILLPLGWSRMRLLMYYSQILKLCKVIRNEWVGTFQERIKDRMNGFFFGCPERYYILSASRKIHHIQGECAYHMKGIRSII